MQKQPLVIIAGPTGAGKSAISIELAKQSGGSVISADSMQVYKGMDIGTAKITPEEMQGVKHYLIDILDPKDEFHVVRFQQLAKEAVKEIAAENRLPIVVGGTGFYIQALLYDIDFTVTGKDQQLRSDYRKFAEENGAEALHDLLKAKDPAAAQSIHPNNIKRVIRALEFHDETHELISEHNEEQRLKDSPYNYLYFVLSDDRALLYDKINRRVDKMFEAGLEKEVRSLYEAGLNEDDISMKGIGYREFFPYFRGECDIADVAEKIKSDTRHFAKRQLTWYRREKDVIMIDKSSFGHDNDKILGFMLGEIKRKLQC